MFCRQVDFAAASALIEITLDGAEPGAGCVARLSLVEDGDTIVRPIVGPDGRSIKFRALGAGAAFDAAIEYLEHRFGPVQQPQHACALGAATLGTPVEMTD
jgi:hypothetical protein